MLQLWDFDTSHDLCAIMQQKYLSHGQKWVRFHLTSAHFFLPTPPRILSDTGQRAVLALAGHTMERVMLHSSASDSSSVCLSGLVILFFLNIKIEKYAHAHYNNCSIIYACIWHPHSFFHRFTYYRLLMDSKQSGLCDQRSWTVDNSAPQRTGY